MQAEGALSPFSAPSASNTANFYSIQINPFLRTLIFQLAENKALPFFYSIQMGSHKSLLTNHYSPVLAPFAAGLEARPSSLAKSGCLVD
jgi:hypothetical protein